MLTKYKFDIEGNIRSEDGYFPVKVGEVFINFVTEDNKIVAIEIVEPTESKDIPHTTKINGKIDSILTGDRADDVMGQSL